MKTNTKLEPIKGASNYGVSPCGGVFNIATGTKQAEQIYRRRVYVSVCDDEGKRRLIEPRNPNLEPATLPDAPMRLIDGYPDYRVTDYGAVWKVSNTGKRYRNQPFLCASTTKGGKEYYVMWSEDNKKRWVRMSAIMA